MEFVRSVGCGMRSGVFADQERSKVGYVHTAAPLPRSSHLSSAFLVTIATALVTHPVLCGAVPKPRSGKFVPLLWKAELGW